MNHLAPLVWDSEFLAFGVSRLPAHSLTTAALEQLVQEARQAGTRLLYVVATPTDAFSNASALQAGAWLADRKVIFVHDVEPGAATLAISPAIHSITASSPVLESLALQSGKYSRFRRDKRFSPAVFPKLYQHWLHNSLSHQLAREVFAVEAGTGHPAPASATHCGLLTLGIADNRATIGLLAVDESARRQKIGQQLVAAARQRTAAWGLRELQVATQLDNEPACAFYRRCGFREARVEHIYHLWL
ncbi:hypothetical protein BEN47_19265 [Hymenobacter lapidarius]|uniref:N-acetyltransferase domain-containing protein n=1 Tax=Hymenobacter lapidarius TaxID=1908237 RepID=A0A1G1SRV1_9BACT|nr:hypothetical protein BEN47_19265 [Hymenobacter lapidarius]